MNRDVVCMAKGLEIVQYWLRSLRGLLQNTRPRWDGIRLWLGENQILDYQKKAAPEQAAILDALQKVRWPTDPVPLDKAYWSTRSVNCCRINKKMKDHRIRLHAAGDGKSVTWSRTSEMQ